MAKKILVVDDDRELLKMLKIMLAKSSYEVKALPSGHKLIEKTLEFRPDLVVLDLMLPDVDGLDLCKQLKTDAATKEIPVIMLTAKSTELDKVVGLEMGAEDYITKPFGVNELLARIKKVLQRPVTTAPDKGTLLKSGGIKLDDERHEVTLNDELLKLTPIEYHLLKSLLERVGKVLPRDELLEKVWGYDNMANTRTVDVHVRRLRQKLGAAAKCLTTVGGVGYKLVE